jgi:hypothetical protein
VRGCNEKGTMHIVLPTVCGELTHQSENAIYNKDPKNKIFNELKQMISTYCRCSVQAYSTSLNSNGTQSPDRQLDHIFYHAQPCDYRKN